MRSGNRIRGFVGSVILVSAAMVAMGSPARAQTFDSIAFDFGAEAGKSLKNGMAVTLAVDIGDAEFVQNCEGDNPIGLALGVNAVTFSFTYANGYSFSATGHILVTSHVDVPVDNPHPFLGLSYIAHLRVDGTNQNRGQGWPRPGDDVIGAGELVIGSDPPLGEAVYRIVRPAAN